MASMHNAAVAPVRLDLAVEALKAARNRPAVLKLQIAKLRAASPMLPILVFEGDDDKIIYYHWIEKIRPRWKYASFPCGGKGQVLKLRTSLQRDVTGLSAGIYFLVDRDYDDLRDQQPGPDIFMTDAYSVENYLVSDDVLEKILEIEFHCHGAPDVRALIKDRFRESYGNFLEVTKEINRRLYIARRNRIEIKSISDNINDIASVALGSTAVGRRSAEDVISHATPSGDIDLNDEESDIFDEFDPKKRYRGKFALIFFMKWLHLLAEENKVDDRGVFRGLDSRAPFRFHELGLNCFASRSTWPSALDKFLENVQPPPSRADTGASR